MNRSVLVTGATNGTGFAIASRFAKEGYDVFIASRDQARATEAAEKIAEEYGVFSQGFGLEVLNEQQIIDMYDTIAKTGRKVNALVCNAANLGIGLPDITEIDFAEWIRVVDTNIGWNFLFARHAAKQMKELGKGAIVVVGSVTAIRPIMGRSAYCASKAGLHGLVKALAIDLGPYNIRVNLAVPGTIKTARYYANPNIKNNPSTRVPLHDVAEFEDVANAAYFLASDEARIITGAEIAVDGGGLCQLVYEETTTK